MVRYAYLVSKAKCNFLFLFFGQIGTGNIRSSRRSIARFGQFTMDSPDFLKQEVITAVHTFAEYLKQYLIQQVLAPGVRPSAQAMLAARPDLIPSLDPTFRSAVGTHSRAHNFRARCLVRDKHRCVVTQWFDFETANRCVISWAALNRSKLPISCLIRCSRRHATLTALSYVFYLIRLYFLFA